jgi:hypothetical protein
MKNPLTVYFLTTFIFALSFAIKSKTPSFTPQTAPDTNKKDNQNILNEEEIINFKMALVYVPVIVFDKNNPVFKNLNKTDFRVYEMVSSGKSKSSVNRMQMC